MERIFLGLIDLKRFLFVFVLIVFPHFNIFSSGAGLRLSPDVSSEMLDAGFWISRSENAEKVMLNPEEIAELNKKSMEIQRNDKKTILFNLAGVAPLFESDLYKFFSPESSGRNWYRKNILEESIYCTPEYWDSLFEKVGVNALKDSEIPVELETAVCTKRSDMRIVPSDEVFSTNGSDWYDDANQESALLFNDPVLLLFRSKDELWSFVCSEYDYGWVKSDSIALCSDKDFERRLDFFRAGTSSFVTVTESLYVITSDDITLPEDGETVYDELRMGERFFCADWETAQDYFSEERFPFCSYAVEIPFRKEDGTLGNVYASVPVSAVCIGFLPYTVKNILTLAFKSLGQGYSWGGKNGLRDCSSFLMECYRCVGIQLPRNSSEQALFPAKKINLNPDFSIEYRNRILSSAVPGALLKIPSHIMMYLGEYEGRHYVIHSTYGYYETQEDIYAGRIMKVNSVNINTLDVLRGNGRSLLESVSSVLFY